MKEHILPTPSFGEAKSKCLKTCAGTRYPLFRQNKRWKKKKRKNTGKSKTKLVRRTGYTGCRCSKLALHKHIRPVTADDGNARVTTHPNTTSQQAAGHAENGKHTQPSGPSRENRLNREMGERRERERDRSETHAHSREDEEEKGRKKRKKKKTRERERERKRSSSAASFFVSMLQVRLRPLFLLSIQGPLRQKTSSLHVHPHNLFDAHFYSFSPFPFFFVNSFTFSAFFFNIRIRFASKNVTS